jgi:hypothetical protein
MKRLRRFAAMLSVAGGLAACAAVHTETTTSFMAQHRNEARELERKGLLAEAQLHWRYVAALAPGDAEAASELKHLNDLIRIQRDKLVSQGEAELKAQRTRQATALFLKALALDGSDSRARARLGEMQTRVMFASQNNKDQKALADYKAQVEKQTAEKPTEN